MAKFVAFDLLPPRSILPFHASKSLTLALAIAAASLMSVGVAYADVIDNNATTNIWAGYATTGSTYTSVTGSWVIPTIQRNNTSSPQQTSIWVGLDGYGNGTVEQAGISANSTNGNTTYYAWYEFYPANEVTIPLAVAPGNSITASITYIGSAQYTVSVINNSTGFSYVNTFVSTGDQRATAEWIVETPQYTQNNVTKVYTLPNFGTVNFTGASVSDASHSGAINAFNYTAIDLVSSNSNATTSGLNSSGNGFTVTYVPEPASMGLLAIGGALLIRRRSAR